MKNTNSGFIKYILNNHKLYKNSDCVFIEIEHKEHGQIIVPTESVIFERYIGNSYHKKYKTHLLSRQKKEIIYLLNEESYAGSRPIDVYHRYVYKNNAIYINLCDGKNIVKASKKGIRVIPHKISKAKFIYKNNLLPMPEPNLTPDDKVIDKFWGLINVTNKYQRHLVLAWTLNAMYVKTNCPILVVNGKKGSGKSTLQKFIKMILDPEESGLITLPNTQDGIANAIANRFVVSCDNVTEISPAVSIILCQAVTGGLHTKRLVYTSRGESSINLCRPIILNGINNFVEADDLLDRCLILTLDSIDSGSRLKESSVNDRFDQIRGDLFGWMLTALQKIMKVIETTHPSESPRLADFYTFGLAAEKALNWQPGMFKKAFRFNMNQRYRSLLENSEIAHALLLLKNSNMKSFSGTYKELTLLIHQHDSSVSIKPRGLSSELEVIKIGLKKIYGIKVIELKRSNKGHRLKIKFN